MSTSTDTLQAELTFAWQWFEYHAGQRLKAFHFFLIIVGVVAVAYAQSIEHGWEPLGVAIAALGAIVGCAFLAIDIRNQELVDCGLAALKQLEPQLSVSILGDADERKWLAGALGKGRVAAWASTRSRQEIFKHRRWLRLIEGFVTGMFVLGMVWAASGFAGA